MNEHRQFERRRIYMPVAINTEARRDRLGLIRDMSETGMLFHSRSKFAIGERVTLEFSVEAERDGAATGQVVRADRDQNEDNMFPFLTAIQFDAPLPKLPKPSN